MALQQVKSRWRRYSQRVIAEVLETLPGVATRAAAVEALRAAYPWGERRYLPYRHWCHEVKHALNRRWPEPTEPYAVHVYPIGVWCDWCESSLKSCLACSRLREENPPSPDRLRELSAFHRRLCNVEPVTEQFADWLEDIGADELAWTVRAAIAKHPRSVKQRNTAVVMIVGRFVRELANEESING